MSLGGSSIAVTPAALTLFATFSPDSPEAKHVAQQLRVCRAFPWFRWALSLPFTSPRLIPPLLREPRVGGMRFPGPAPALTVHTHRNILPPSFVMEGGQDSRLYSEFCERDEARNKYFLRTLSEHSHEGRPLY